jgi:hypothetical protein
VCVYYTNITSTLHRTKGGKKRSKRFGWFDLFFFCTSLEMKIEFVKENELAPTGRFTLVSNSFNLAQHRAFWWKCKITLVYILLFT